MSEASATDTLLTKVVRKNCAGNAILAFQIYRNFNYNNRLLRSGWFSVSAGTVAEKVFAYCCPWCKANVLSNVKTGQINHRTICENRFYAKDGVAKPVKVFEYSCPWCKAKVSSSVRTGEIDHRRVCGHRFDVKDGQVNPLAKHPNRSGHVQNKKQARK